MKVATKISRTFGGLKVRYKLMILHNLFFLLLVAAVWLTLLPLIHEPAQEAATIALLGVLAAVYIFGVLILELLVLRLYIYRPLRWLLEADAASRRGDTKRELIDEKLVLGDELGQIMSSRNATLVKLRRHEQELEQIAADLRRKNELLEAAKLNIANQDRLASIGLLSASVAHELNTPLAVLHGSIEKLIETIEDSHSQERLARMLRVTKRLQKLSESLVDFARVRRQDVEAVSVRPLIVEAWSLVAIDEKAAGVRFDNRVDEQDQILGNSDRLIQLFVNVLRNALHAIKSGGSILVRSRGEIVNGQQLVVVAVEDDGPGIPSDVLPDIFEAFVTTRLDARGTGLGLTVAEGIAHQHGGAITAANRPQGGACLEVRIPAAALPVSAPEGEI